MHLEDFVDKKDGLLVKIGGFAGSGSRNLGDLI
jgi:hypothetical protein